ncbi:MAG TPA: hypothetical protein VFY50_03185 [Candidatus Nitrosocosmicus sp.]|nr:hypothetical protein [Candidatus Nitrosocosmicus sp.]
MDNDDVKFKVQNLLTVEPPAKFDSITAFEVILIKSIIKES